jgi:hypothetical protein
MCQSREVLLLAQHLGLEGLQSGGQGCSSIPDLFRTDQPEGWVLGKPRRAVEVFVTCQATVDGLAQQVGEGELRILPSSGVRQILFDQCSEPQPLVEFAHQDQAAVGSDAGTLESDLERGVKRELKRMISRFTHWELASGAPSSCSNPHQY